MRISKYVPGLLLSFSLPLLCSCIEEPPVRVEDNSNFRLLMGGEMTRSVDSDAILDNMQLYCFSQSSNAPLSGNGGSWNSDFSHSLLGVTRTNMTLHTSQARAGDWDLVMVSSAGAVFTPPVSNRTSSQALMYTYTPGNVQADGSRNPAHEIWHRMLRLPTIGGNTTTNASTGITRNASMVRVVIDRAVDVDVNSTNHLFELRGVPNKISWSGTLLRTVSPGVYETSLSNPDVLPEPLTGKFTFTDNSAVETGTYKSDTLTFIIPAHREADFWADATTPSTIAQDTITHKMKVFVSLTRASGGSNFEKEAEINHVHRCNGILEVHIRMKDTGIELNTSVTPWEPDEPIDGNVTPPFLNVSDLTTTVYDGAASRFYFWSNQPADSVYVLNNANNINVNEVFDRIAGPGAANLHYDPLTGSGYIDIAIINITNSVSVNRTITLKAGNLRRNITVNTTTTAQVRKGITTPYIGTFHKADQVGERVVTWKYTDVSTEGYWTAYIDPELSGGDVLIDRLPSPSFSNGTASNALYGTSPTDAELSTVSDGGVSVSGRNTIYFRVGWKNTILPTDEPRYATITIRKGINDPSGEKIRTLYLRQGEKASAVFTDSRTNPARFSVYNLTVKSTLTNQWNQSIGPRGGDFTEFPTQSGAHFQWMDAVRSTYAYRPHGIASSWHAIPPFYEFYWTEPGSELRDDYETCPPNYRRVSDGATNGEPTGTSELRQSLWLDPNAANAANTLTGYYADGFFDRRAIVNSANSSGGAVTYSAVGTGTDVVAYKGRLFYNELTKASLFFPAAGQHLQNNGYLTEAGAKGYYWTASSTVSTTPPIGARAYISTSLRNAAINIRCVVEE
ncbi:hypothetical protein [Bacteroides sp. UBA939]|uniref:hypothetical protein n=1 Tax=Bacteroides sp. UBA939 TaxID=1946092 RepID=UPI0025C22944|nr:hypothetical protein [Bacteroides sp. UBA939]